MKTEKLTSIKLQQMININDLDVDLWCPVLRFGRKQYKFPIVFKNYKQAEKLYDELEKLKGNTIEQVKEASEKLYTKFKKHHRK